MHSPCAFSLCILQVKPSNTGEHACVDNDTLAKMHHYLKYAVAVYALDPHAVLKQQR